MRHVECSLIHIRRNGSFAWSIRFLRQYSMQKDPVSMILLHDGNQMCGRWFQQTQWFSVRTGSVSWYISNKLLRTLRAFVFFWAGLAGLWKDVFVRSWQTIKSETLFLCLQWWMIFSVKCFLIFEVQIMFNHNLQRTGGWDAMRGREIFDCLFANLILHWLGVLFGNNWVWAVFSDYPHSCLFPFAFGGYNKFCVILVMRAGQMSSGLRLNPHRFVFTGVPDEFLNKNCSSFWPLHAFEVVKPSPMLFSL